MLPIYAHHTFKHAGGMLTLLESKKIDAVVHAELAMDGHIT